MANLLELLALIQIAPSDMMCVEDGWSWLLIRKINSQSHSSFRALLCTKSLVEINGRAYMSKVSFTPFPIKNYVFYLKRINHLNKLIFSALIADACSH